MEKIKEEIDGIKYESVFSKDLKFKCKRCAFCCYSDDIEIDQDDITRIENNTQFKSRNFVDNSKSSKRLKHNDGPCMFLENNSCSIHKFRPKTCRNFPYKVFFEEVNMAYLDIIHACPSVVMNDSEENEIDFNKLVFKTYKEIERDPKLLSFMGRMKDKIKDNIDKKLVVEKVLSHLFSELSNPFDGYKLAFSLNESRKKIKKLKFSVVDQIIQDVKNVDFKPSIEEFNRSSLDMLSLFETLKSVDITDMSIYFIKKTDKGIEFISKGKTKKIDEKKLYKNQVSLDEYSGILGDYLLSLWNKKIMEYESYTYVLEQLKLGNEVSTLGFQLDFYKHALMFLNMVLLILMDAKMVKEINADIVKEAIIMTDPFLLSLTSQVRRFYNA